AVPLYREDVANNEVVVRPPMPRYEAPQETHKNIEPQMAEPVMQEPVAPSAPLLSAPAPVARTAPAPQGDIPLVEAMPLDPDEARHAPVVMQPSAPAQPVAPQVQMQPDVLEESAPTPVQIAAAQPQESAPVVMPQTPADAQVANVKPDSEDDMFIPVTN